MAQAAVPVQIEMHPGRWWMLLFPLDSVAVPEGVLCDEVESVLPLQPL